MRDGKGLSFCHRKVMKTGRGENAFTRFPLRNECFYRRKEEEHSWIRDIFNLWKKIGKRRPWTQDGA
jgi:hypothetical protein